MTYQREVAKQTGDGGDYPASGLLPFLEESERLATVARTVDLSRPGDYHVVRKQSSAEHSWHLAVTAMSLKGPLLLSDADELKLLRMLLVHDLPEVYAGDTPSLESVEVGAEGAYMQNQDKKARQRAREAAAADRLFGLLPAHARSIGEDWREFEGQRTPLAVLAKTLDKVHPLLQNRFSDGKDYKHYGSTLEIERDLMEPHLRRLEGSSPVHGSQLRELTDLLLRDADAAGWLHGPPIGTESTVRVVKLLHRDGRGRVLLARNKGVDAFYLPGGKPFHGEGLEDALVREVHEELGVLVRPSSLRSLGVHTGSAHGRGAAVEMHLYSAEFLHGQQPVASNEIEEIRFVSVADAQWLLPPLAAKLVQMFCEEKSEQEKVEESLCDEGPNDGDFLARRIQRKDLTEGSELEGV